MVRKKDLTGLQFGYSLVLKEFGRTKHGNITWLCKCLNCYNFTVVSGGNLTSGHTTSCGCYNREKSSERISEVASKQTGKNHPMYKDLTGLQFGCLLALKDVGRTKNKQVLWLCKCLNCYNFKIVTEGSLTSGNTKSCGCLHDEKAAERCKQMTGENHPNWNGGSSFLPYCPKFNEEKKEEIRDKYNRRCVLCGKSEEENGRKLDVHHIDRNKDQGCNGHGWDLVPLCRKCHGKVHSKETEKYYESLIRARMRIHILPKDKRDINEKMPELQQYKI